MQQADYVALLRGGVPTPGGVWADFGSGPGAYTLALAELIGLGSTLYAIDKDASALAAQARQMADKFPQVQLKQLNADFTVPITPALPPLDGLVLANVLHLVPDHQKADLVRLLKSYLKPGGRWLLVDYNADHGNSWVPYPLAYPTWEALAAKCGLEQVRLLGTHPNSFLKEFYAAEAMTPPPPPPAPPKAPPAKLPAASAAKGTATKKKTAVTPKKK